MINKINFYLYTLKDNISTKYKITFIENYLMAHQVYEKFKNIQVPTILEKLIEVLAGIKSLELKQLQPKDLQRVITGVIKPYDIC